MKPEEAIALLDEHRSKAIEAWWGFLFTPSRELVDKVAELASAKLITCDTPDAARRLDSKLLELPTQDEAWVSFWPTTGSLDDDGALHAEIGWIRANARKHAIMSKRKNGLLFVLPSSLKPLIKRSAPLFYQGRDFELQMLGEAVNELPADDTALLHAMAESGLDRLGIHLIEPPKQLPKTRAYAAVLTATGQLIEARHVNAVAVLRTRGTEEEPELWRQAAEIHKQLEEYIAARTFAALSHRLTLQTSKPLTPKNLTKIGRSFLFLDHFTKLDTSEKAIEHFRQAAMSTGQAEHQLLWADALLILAEKIAADNHERSLAIANEAAELERGVREDDPYAGVWIRVRHRILRGRSASRRGSIRDGQRLQHQALIEAFGAYCIDPLNADIARRWTKVWKHLNPEATHIPHPDAPTTIVTLATLITRNIGLGLDRDTAMNSIQQLEALVRTSDKASEDLRVLCTAFRIDDEC